MNKYLLTFVAALVALVAYDKFVKGKIGSGVSAAPQKISSTDPFLAEATAAINADGF